MMENSPFRQPIDGAPGRGVRESVIDQDCYFEGTFRTPGNMRVEGTYEGQIECQGTLLIAENGNVNARIAAGSLIVAGRLAGEAQCESRFELLRTGRASGAIVAKSTVVHEGAFFEGEIHMGGELASARGAAATTAAPQPAAAIVPAEAPPAAEETTSEDEEPPLAGAPVAAPRSNGRRSGARDVLPNRTGEA